TGLPAVGFVIHEGRKAQQFGDFTGKFVGKHLTILLDGQVQSNAVINSKIPGNGVIEGGSDGFSQDELKRLISVIRSGSLPQKPELQQQYTQGPSLGEAAIKRAVYALLTTFVIIAGFMLVYYRLAGVVANVALICNLLLLTASMAFLKATLTLPGVA